MYKWVNPAFTPVLVITVESYLLWVVLEPVAILYYILGPSQSKEFHTMSTEYPCLQRNHSSVSSSCTTTINTTTKEWKQITRTLWVGGPTPLIQWRVFLNKHKGDYTCSGSCQNNRKQTQENQTGTKWEPRGAKQEVSWRRRDSRG